ncbi:hypothetical protein HAX54_031105, partial [Datura stramonium]|nr:hypothetical protein [Datura stramonium]
LAVPARHLQNAEGDSRNANDSSVQGSGLKPFRLTGISPDLTNDSSVVIVPNAPKQ